MRLDAPPERITAASMTPRLMVARNGPHHRANFLLQFLVRGRGRTAAHGDELSHDADGDLFGRKRANLQAHGGVNACKFLGAVAFPLERLVDGKYFTLAADHADIARVS